LQKLWEIIELFLTKLNIILSYDPVINPFGIHPKS
jgi:hypothetical protein